MSKEELAEGAQQIVSDVGAILVEKGSTIDSIEWASNPSADPESDNHTLNVCADGKMITVNFSRESIEDYPSGVSHATGQIIRTIPALLFNT